MADLDSTSFAFTDTRIASALKSHKNDCLIKDSTCKGLELVRSEGQVRWRYFRRINGKLYNRKLGEWPALCAKDAQQLAQKLYADLVKGHDPREEKLARQAAAKVAATTVREALQQMLSEGSYRPATVISYERLIKPGTGLLADYADEPLLNITPDLIKKLHADRSLTSPSLANKDCRTIRAVWNYSRRKLGITEPAPTDALKKTERVSGEKGWAKVPRRRTAIYKRDLREWLTAVRTLQSPLSDPQYRTPTIQRQALAAELMLLTGMRRMEVLSMRWEWVNLRRSVIELPKEAKKAGVAVAHPITARVREILLKAREGEVTRFVFPSEVVSTASETDQGRTHMDSINALADAVERLTGLRHPPNDLRRTFQSAANSAGVSPVLTKVLMSHAFCESDVTQGYQSDDIEVIAEAAQKVEDWILKQATSEHSLDLQLRDLISQLDEHGKRRLIFQLSRDSSLAHGGRHPL